MSEQTPLKRLTGTVTYRKDEDERRARIGFQPDDGGQVEYYDLWRTNYQTKLPNPCDSKCVKGAYGTLVLRFKRGNPKVKGDPSQGFYPDKWEVFDIDLADDHATAQDAREVFSDSPVEAPESPVQRVQPSRGSQTGLTDRDRQIMYQSARKDAAVIEAAFITSMGWELWEKERGWASVKATTEDCYKMVLDLANNGFDPFAGE